MAVNREFSATRTHATWKPRVTEDAVPFYRCPTCGNIHMGLSDGNPATTIPDGRAPIFELPYRNVGAPACCGAEMERIPLVSLEDLPEEVQLDFVFKGGFNANCVKIKWFIKFGADYAVEWAAVKTFTGVQIKYVTPKKYSPLTFAFADEDAFVYCDTDPCEECRFRCKLGMESYVYVRNVGLVYMPFNRMQASGSGIAKK